MEQRDSTPGGYTPPFGAQPPQQPNKKANKALGCGCLGLVAVIAIAAIAVASKDGSGSSGTSASTTSATTTAAVPVDTATAIQVDTSEAAPITTQPTVAEHVTYACTGSAPDGVDITYGPAGSQYEASSLPFSKTVVLDDSAEYYDTQGQLQGSGSVTCTTTVQTSDGTRVVNSGTAQGGYNIADAEICSTFDGGWDKC